MSQVTVAGETATRSRASGPNDQADRHASMAQGGQTQQSQTADIDYIGAAPIPGRIAAPTADANGSRRHGAGSIGGCVAGPSPPRPPHHPRREPAGRASGESAPTSRRWSTTPLTGARGDRDPRAAGTGKSHLVDSWSPRLSGSRSSRSRSTPDDSPIRCGPRPSSGPTRSSRRVVRRGPGRQSDQLHRSLAGAIRATGRRTGHPSC